MISVAITRSLLRGAAELETRDRGVRPHRLPAWVRQRFPDGQLLMMESQPSGVRLVFRTAASAIELVTHATRLAYRGADRPRGTIDVVVDGVHFARDTLTGGDTIHVDLATGGSTMTQGPSHTSTVSGLPAGESLVEIWLPHNETIDLLSLRVDAADEAVPAVVADDEHRPVWVHHGSSISHGSNATAPSDTWPAVAARRAGVDLVNLGFGGSALVDPFLAQVIRDTAADCISVKIGINLVNTDVMRLRAFVPAVHGFLDTIRDGHPTTPVLLVSPIFAAIHETTPGPGAVDPASLGTDQVRFIATGDPADVAAGKLTLEVIRRELASIVDRRQDDPHLHHLDGLDLYGPVDSRELPLADGLHPSTAAHHRIGERFAARAFGPGGAFTRTRRTP